MAIQEAKKNIAKSEAELTTERAEVKRLSEQLKEAEVSVAGLCAESC
jgi:hypothetical protein